VPLLTTLVTPPTDAVAAAAAAGDNAAFEVRVPNPLLYQTHLSTRSKRYAVERVGVVMLGSVKNITCLTFYRFNHAHFWQSIFALLSLPSIYLLTLSLTLSFTLSLTLSLTLYSFLRTLPYQSHLCVLRRLLVRISFLTLPG
jgi:hypothetical protein